MGQKYLISIKRTNIGILEVFRFSKSNEWTIGYRFDTKDKRHLIYGKTPHLFLSQFAAQQALDKLAKDQNLEAVNEGI